MTKYPVAGTASQIAYGWESPYGTGGTVNKAFSQGVKVTTYDIDNDAEYIYQIGSQDVQRSIAKTFKGSWGVEFILSDPWWLRSILGGAPTTAGSAPYLHTWTIANSGISNTQSSMNMIYGFDLDTDSEQTLLGCITNNATITCAVGDPIRVKLDGWFKTLTKDSSLAAQVAPVEEPLTFAGGTFQMPNSTTKTDVQSVELSWTRNNDPVYAIGSRFPQQNVPKAREWNLRISSTYEQDDDFWDTLLGGSAAPAASPAEADSSELTISNGGTGSSMRSFAMTFGNTFLSKGSLPSSPEELTKVDLDARARNITCVTVANNTATAL